MAVPQGGGVRIIGTGTVVTFQSCTISNNQARDVSGGLFSYGDQKQALLVHRPAELTVV